MKFICYLLLLFIFSCSLKANVETFESGFFPRDKTYFLTNEATSLEGKYYQNLLEIVLQESGMEKVFSKEKADYSLTYKYSFQDSYNLYNTSCFTYLGSVGFLDCDTSTNQIFTKRLELKAFNKQGEEVYSTSIYGSNTRSLYAYSHCIFEALRMTFPSKIGAKQVKLNSYKCDDYFKYNLLSEKQKGEIKQNKSDKYNKINEFHRKKRNILEKEFYSTI
jgi:hypothetical protein